MNLDSLASVWLVRGVSRHCIRQAFAIGALMSFPKSLVDVDLSPRFQKMFSFSLDSQSGDDSGLRSPSRVASTPRSVAARLVIFGMALTSLLLGSGVALAQNSTVFGPNVYVFTH